MGPVREEAESEAADVEPFQFRGAPYTVSLDFPRPVYEPAFDTVSRNLRDMNTQPKSKLFSVSLSVPKVKVNAATHNTKTSADLYLHIEIPQGESRVRITI